MFKKAMFKCRLREINFESNMDKKKIFRTLCDYKFNIS